MMDIRVKAALRMSAVFGVGMAAAGVLFLANTFVSQAFMVGTILGCLGGFALYNIYQIFLTIEQMKENNKK